MDAKKINREPGILGAHFRTLRIRRGTTDWIVWPVVIRTIFVPLAIAIFVYAIGIRITGVDAVTSGVAILAGLLFALVIFVFQLRMSVTHDPRVQSGDLLPQSIDELFANVTYAVVVSLAATVVSVVASNSQAVSGKTGLPIGTEPWVSGVLVLIGAHLIAVIIEALRRTRTAYNSLRNIADTQAVGATVPAADPSSANV